MQLEGLPANRKVCVLLSGGSDSALLLRLALDNGLEVTPVHVASGFIWEAAEKYWLDRLVAALGSPRIRPVCAVPIELSALLDKNWAFTGKDTPDAVSADEAVFIPGRNLLLFSLAALACHRDRLGEIWIGSLKQNPFSDTTDRFFRDFEASARSGLEIEVKIRAPFRDLEKSDLLKRYPDFPYELTFSCIRPQGMQHCGQCNKCAERQSHLKVAGIADNTVYIG